MKLPRKICDAPGMSVIICERSPPVQLSAVARVMFWSLSVCRVAVASDCSSWPKMMCPSAWYIFSVVCWSCWMACFFVGNSALILMETMPLATVVPTMGFWFRFRMLPRVCEIADSPWPNVFIFLVSMVLSLICGNCCVILGCIYWVNICFISLGTPGMTKICV